MKKSKVVIIGIICVVITISLGLGSCLSLFGGRTVEEGIDVANFVNRSMLLGTVMITDDGIPKRSPVVSPDGSRLLYCETRVVRDAATGQDVTQSDIVMLRNVNSPAKTPLITTGNAFTPGWYDDNTRFLYSFGENNAYRIVRSSSAGGGRTNITRNPVGGRDENPSIKNGVIVFTTREGGRWVINSVLENGSEVTRLIEGFDPAWHPTENKIIYVNGSPSGIRILNMNTMQEEHLYEMPRFNIRRPKYTHDGKHIVFQRGSEQALAGTQVVTANNIIARQTRTASTEVRWQLYAITSEGFNETVLTEGNVDCTFPSLDKDNNLFFLSNARGVRTNRTEIYKARLNFSN